MRILKNHEVVNEAIGVALMSCSATRQRALATTTRRRFIFHSGFLAAMICCNHVFAETVFDNLAGSRDSGFWWNAPEERSAQPFVLEDNDTVNSVTIQIGGEGQPNGNLYVEIWDDSGSGTPGKSVGQVGEIDALSVARDTSGVRAGRADYLFDSPVSGLTPNEPYYVVVSTDGTNWSGTSRVVWGLTTRSGYTRSGFERGAERPGEALAIAPPTVADWHTINNFPTGGPSYRVFHFMSVDAIESLLGDFNADGALGAADIDLLSKSVRNSSTEHVFDLNSDGEVNDSDRTFWVEDLVGTSFGDANLDGNVEFSDFLTLSANFDQEGGWARGDFDGNGHVQFADFLALSNNFGKSTNVAAAAVPEPTSAYIALFGILGLIGFRRRH